MFRKTLVAMVFGGILFGASVASASSIYIFSTSTCSTSCGSAPFGSVTLTQTGTTVDVLIHLSNGEGYVKTGAGDDQAFKFNATGVALGDITVDPHTPGLIATTGSYSGDGGGAYTFGINCPTCGGGGSGAFFDDISFHVADALIADLVSPNGNGFIFAADILGTNGNTGLVEVTGCSTDCVQQQLSEVPEPGSLLLLGSGLVGAAMRLRKRASLKN
jgi:hypothetical protein